MDEVSKLRHQVITCNARFLVRAGLLGKRSLRTGAFFVCILVLTLQMFINLFAEFDQLQVSMFNGLFAVVALCILLKTVIHVYQSDTTLSLLQTIDDLMQSIRDGGHPDSIAILEQDNKYMLVYSKVMAVMCGMAAFAFDLNIFWFPSSSGRRLIYNTWAPFNQQRTPYYELTWVFQVFVTFISVVLFAADHNLIILSLHFGRTLCRVLQEEIKLIAAELGAETSSRRTIHQGMLDKRFEAVIERHRQIFRYSEQLQEALSMTLATEYTCFAFVLCAEMFMISIVNNVSHMLMIFSVMALYLTTSFMWNYHAELMRTEHALVSQRMFDIPWINADRRAKFAVQFMIFRCQKPLNILIAGIIPIGLDCYLTLINTAYSYFTVFASINN